MWWDLRRRIQLLVVIRLFSFDDTESFRCDRHIATYVILYCDWITYFFFPQVYQSLALCFVSNHSQYKVTPCGNVTITKFSPDQVGFADLWAYSILT